MSRSWILNPNQQRLICVSGAMSIFSIIQVHSLIYNSTILCSFCNKSIEHAIFKISIIYRIYEYQLSLSLIFVIFPVSNIVIVIIPDVSSIPVQHPSDKHSFKQFNLLIRWIHQNLSSNSIKFLGYLVDLTGVYQIVLIDFYELVIECIQLCGRIW